MEKYKELEVWSQRVLPNPDCPLFSCELSDELIHLLGLGLRSEDKHLKELYTAPGTQWLFLAVSSVFISTIPSSSV